MDNQQQIGTICQTARIGVNCENMLRGRSQKPRAAHHGIFFLWDTENEQVQWVRRDYLLFVRESIQKSRNVSLGLTGMFWN